MATPSAALAEGLYLFVQACQDRGVHPEDILTASQHRGRWIFNGCVSQGWTVEIGEYPQRRYAVDTDGELHRATRTWRMSRVPRVHKIRRTSHYLLSTGPAEDLEDAEAALVLQAFTALISDR